MKPTPETYGELQSAYDLFNRELFDGQLPDCLLTLQREKRSYGYFSAQRFQRADGTTADEIAMNPIYFGVVPLVEIMQTVAHEMCHLWQFHLGEPGRGRYHNQQWAEKMEAIGLMPSSTGKPGGRRTGDHIADYPIEGGRFLKACQDLLTQQFRISWYDRFPSTAAVHLGQQSHGLVMDLPLELTAVAGGENSQLKLIPEQEQEPAMNRSNRSKYTCSCETNVWGKPGLALICGNCNEPFHENN